MLKSIFALISIIFVTGCWLERSADTELNVPLKTEVTTIDPHLSYDYVSNFVTHQMYDTLFAFHFLKRPYTIEPLIAEAIPEFSNGGKEVIVKIKPNISYHPFSNNVQRVVKAADFVRSFKRLAYKHTGSRAWWLVKNTFVGLDEIHEKCETLDELNKAPLDGIKALDDLTLKFTLKRGLPPHQILNLLTMTFTAPMPEEIFTTLNNNLSQTDVGTGAYQLVKVDIKKEMNLKAFHAYQTIQYPNVGDRYSHDQNLLIDANKKIPFVENINFKVEVDEKMRWEQFKNKQFSFVELPRPYTEEVLQEDGGISSNLSKNHIQMEQSSSLAFWFIEFNMKDSLLSKNLNLRKAIAYAIDVKNFLWNFSHNADQKANSLFTPGIFGYSASKELPYAYNLDLAKSFLAKAGYPQGKGLPTIIFDTRRETEAHVKQAEYIKQALSAIGINLQIRINNFTQFIDRVKNNSMTMWQGGWLLDFPDAENILQLFYSKNAGNGGPNKSHFSNTAFDALYEQMIKLENNQKKLELLSQLEDIILKEMPIVMLYYSKNYFLFHQEIKNFRFNELSMGFLKFIRVTP